MNNEASVSDTGRQRERTLWGWLFNPFQYVAGARALVVGLAAIALMAVLGWRVSVHFDGVLDVHFGLAAPLWMHLAEGAIDWLSMSVVMLLCGLLVARPGFRVIDVLGTQALARTPQLLSVLVLTPAAVRASFRTLVDYMMWKSAQGGSPVDVTGGDVALFALGSLVMLAAIVWTVALMYRAYAVSCNTRGGRAVVAFIIGLIAAEAISKLAILLMAQWC